MWAALALTTVLTAPAQAGGDLAVKNVRTTYGMLGPIRKDDKFLPGDFFVIAFDIENLKVKDDGTILYAMGVELTRKEKGGKVKPILKRAPMSMEAVNSLGGTTLPGFAIQPIKPDDSPGEYTLTVTIKDEGVKPAKTVTLEKSFEVLPVKFGFVQVRVTSPLGEPSPPIGVRGQMLPLHCAMVGVEADKKTKLADVTFEMVVLDADGKPTLAKTFKGDIKNPVTPVMQFQPIPLQLNRAGKFTVVLKATDNVGKKSIEQKLDLTVLDN
jgi:hypothetical protein